MSDEFDNYMRKIHSHAADASRSIGALSELIHMQSSWTQTLNRFDVLGNQLSTLTDQLCDRIPREDQSNVKAIAMTSVFQPTVSNFNPGMHLRTKQIPEVETQQKIFLQRYQEKRSSNELADAVETKQALTPKSIPFSISCSVFPPTVDQDGNIMSETAMALENRINDYNSKCIDLKQKIANWTMALQEQANQTRLQLQNQLTNPTIEPQQHARVEKFAQVETRGRLIL